MKPEITDMELIELMTAQFEICRKNSNHHYKDTSDEKITEIYFDKAIEKVLEDLSLTEEESNRIEDRIRNLY